MKPLIRMRSLRGNDMNRRNETAYKAYVLRSMLLVYLQRLLGGMFIVTFLNGRYKPGMTLREMKEVNGITVDRTDRMGFALKVTDSNNPSSFVILHARFVSRGDWGTYLKLANENGESIKEIKTVRNIYSYKDYLLFITKDYDDYKFVNIQDGILNSENEVKGKFWFGQDNRLCFDRGLVGSLYLAEGMEDDFFGQSVPSLKRALISLFGY